MLSASVIKDIIMDNRSDVMAESDSITVKRDIELTAYAHETSKVLGKGGCILVSGNAEKANGMTIGWGFIGMMWGRPMFIVLVRPSRHTFGFMEESGEFTVNVPRKGMEKTMAYFGTVSGRDDDKFKVKGLTLEKGKVVDAPVIKDCAINYECRIVYKEKLVPEKIPNKDLERWYPDGDYHTIYFGEILAATADEDAAENLPL